MPDIQIVMAAANGHVHEANIETARDVGGPLLAQRKVKIGNFNAMKCANSLSGCSC